MSLYKRNNTWWVRFSVGGRRVHASAGTADRARAQEYHDKLKAELWEAVRLNKRSPHTWNEAAVRWLKETDYKASHEKDKAILRWLHPHLDGRWLTDIGPALIEVVREQKRAETSKSTANRHLALVRAILRKAVEEWEWLEKAPKVPMYQVAKRRIRWITQAQAEQLLALLPPHQAAMARFALATGLRQRNVAWIEWSQIDIPRRVAWIHPDQAKAKKAIAVPLNDAAVEVLRQQLGQHDRYVFTYQGHRVSQINTKAWRKAVKQAGLEDFRWHDLRHTWASWHAQAGTPFNALQEMGGWESAEMVRRYAHLAAEHLLEHANRIAPNLHQSKIVKLRDSSK